MKYRPLKGARLEHVLDGKEALEPELQIYLEKYNANNLCIVNIESVPAIEALDAILKVPDVDAILVGPHDLSISLGVPENYIHPKFTAAMKTIIEKSRAAGIGVGYHFSFGLDTAIEWAKMGATFIVHSTDLFLVRDALQRELGQFQSSLGERVRKSAANELGEGNVIV